jgi:hypothetical protein
MDSIPSITLTEDYYYTIKIEYDKSDPKRAQVIAQLYKKELDFMNSFYEYPLDLKLTTHTEYVNEPNFIEKLILNQTIEHKINRIKDRIHDKFIERIELIEYNRKQAKNRRKNRQNKKRIE